ncbi:alpha/beta hydrolase [Micromonospora sp. WMMD956]|uniref:alpha/beta hydrolase n=1 Tax=Micromonospora sp. WMMD956 TaxID=3016108 RepID=UPI002416CCCF|nr:alpha/beta hydrolase [Micromonospora sp. WMMD956]MDG4817648.1 alpha/beta hydrolase [Micromonospora sp. WMMD956]
MRILLAVAVSLTAPVALAAPAMAASPTPAAPPPAAPAGLPDPTARGPFGHQAVQEAKFGLADIQEPNSAGADPTPGTAQAAEQVEIRGQLYTPDWAKRTTPSPLIVLVHGNHGSCDSGQNSAQLTCAQFKHNENGYAYLAENLATWGYTTFSVSQDQLMMRQDSSKGKGMHSRRMLIAATLDALSAANRAGGLPVDEHTTVGTTLSGRLDLTRIGLMGHSRGGDAVSSFIDYNRIRTDGPRYPLRGVISLAPVDYERKAPYGMPYLTILPMCDGDVSNLQGARLFERSQYVNPGDPFPRIQVEHLGAIHNWYNTVWYADGGADGQGNNDAACGNSAPFATNNIHPNNLRLSGAASYTDPDLNYAIDNSDPLNPAVNTKFSGDAARMGDQEKLGLATMAAFFRRYVGGEGAFQPWLTGELANTASGLQVPATACPTSPSGTAIPCNERVNTSYFAAPQERVDVIRPEVENPLGLNALGGPLTGSGFADPYAQAAGVTPKPAATAGGYDWCNPEPQDFAPAQLGKTGLPTAAKPCPLPAAGALGGQNATRENSPINHSYGRQLTLAWEPTSPATLTAAIPAASKDVRGLKALALSAAVNFFDTRNPGADNRGDNTRDTTVNGTPTSPVWPNELPTSYDPTSTTQRFVIALSDTAGHEATVDAGDPRWGNALHMSTGTNTPNTHIVLDQIRVPLSEFAAQGVDVGSLAKLELRFGAGDLPKSGSIQLADVRFQESAAGARLLSDGNHANGAGHGKSALGGPDPATYLAAYDNTPGKVALVDPVANPRGNTTWTVDDDGKQCPTAQFTSIQAAVDHASPWDTIVVCAGVYRESSTPVHHASNPVQAGARNGLTITKPLKIKGAGADKVTIEPDQSLGTLAGDQPYLRDGGGNVITVSRQSLGSTDTNEMFVDISGVTVTSGDVWAEAGIAFFGAAGRVADSVVGPLRAATTAQELAEHPHGWGIVKTGVIRGAGVATVESEVTVTGSVVSGYQSGGILFDGARGTDGSPDNTARTGIRHHGYVTGTVVTGASSSVFPQVGIQYASGATGFVDDSRITGNYHRPAPEKSYGILLTDAGTDTAGALTVSGDIITGNGFAVYNANADNTGVREAAPVTVTGSYLGKRAPLAGGPADPRAGVEAISGPDSTGAATVALAKRLPKPPKAVPTGVGRVADHAPWAQVADPGQGAVFQVGTTVHPLIRGTDDFAIASATLLVNGVRVGTSTVSPYLFDWTPGARDAGRQVKLQALVVDSAGRATLSKAVVGKVAPVTPPPTVQLGKVTTDAKAGTATIAATVNTAGTLTLTGDKVVAVTKQVSRAGTVTLTVTVAPAYRKELVKAGRLDVTVTVAFGNATGQSASRTVQVRLLKK